MKKYIKGIALGALLGIVCVVGASLRSSALLSMTYLFAFWFNRVMMGLMFSFLPYIKSTFNKMIVGIVLGLLVSLMFYSATDFKDLIGFVVGGIYGVILIFSLQFKQDPSI